MPRAENQCSICRDVKLPGDFCIGTKRGKIYQLPGCKDCRRREGRIERARRSDKIKAAAALKSEENIAYQKEYRRKNADRLSAFHKERYLKRKQDPDFKAKVAERARSLRESNPSLRIKEALSSRLLKFLASQGTSKAGRKIMDYVGCSKDELRDHIERQFSKGMTWDNQGFLGWHIDHILPCSSFDHSDENQVRQCWHFTNLRPMWSKANLSKGKKISEPQMKLLL